MNAESRVTIGIPETSSGYPFALILMGVLFLAMTGWYLYALLVSPTDAEWGFFTSNFIYVLGVSQFGVAFSAIMRICGVKWARPYYRAGELATLAFFPFAIFGVLLICNATGDHFFYWHVRSHDPHPTAWLNQPFMLWRNVVAQLLFYGVAIWYFLLGLLPDVKEEDCAAGPAWRRGLYRKLLRMKQRWGEARLRRAAYFYSPIVLVVAVLANTFISLDFSMTLVDHYHTSIFPMHFIVGNMLAGAAALLFLALVLSRLLGLGRFFQTAQVHSLSIVITGFTLLWLYMFWAQFFVSWFGNLDHEYGTLGLRMFGHYGPYFWVMLSCVFFIPLVCLIFLNFKKNWTTMLTLALVINFGMWLHRYLIVVPAVDRDHHPFLNLPEVAMSVGLFAGFFFVLLLFFQTFPMVSNWEMESTAS